MPFFLQGQEAWFTIDNEEFEAMPVEVTLLKDRVKVFCGFNMPSLAQQSS